MGFVRAPGALNALSFAVAVATASPARASPPSPGDAISGPASRPADAEVRVEGRLREAGERAAVTDAVVIVSEPPPGAAVGELAPDDLDHEPGWMETVEPDERGQFVALAPGSRVRLTVVASGYDRIDRVLDVGSRPITVFLRREVDSMGYRTVVAERTPAVAPPVTRAALSREELETVPGSQGDALRGVLNLPGVGRTPGGLGVLVLRGNSPGRSRTYLGAHPIPHGFHFLSLASVVPSSLLDTVELTPGNFEAAYGGSGGLTKIETRAPRRDGVHGSGRADLAAIGATVEAPLGAGSFALGARRGWVDAVLGTVNRAADQNFLLPASWDYQALVDQPVGRAKLRVRALGSSDVLAFRFSDLSGTGIETAFEFRDDFHRVDAELRWRERGWSVLLSPVFRVDVSRWRDSFISPVADTESDRRRVDLIGGARVEARRRLTRRFEVRVGSEVELDWWRGRFDEQFDQVELGLEGFDTRGETRGSQHRIGTYLDARLEHGPLWITPGVRVEAFTSGRYASFAVDPRVVAGWRPGERVELRAGAGLYSQPGIVRLVGVSPLVRDLVGGDPHLQLPPAFVAQLNPTIALVDFDPAETPSPIDRAIGTITNAQGSLGASVGLPRDVTLDVTAFAQHDLPVGAFLEPETVPFSRYASAGWGGEVMLRKPLTKRLYGWIAYTLAWRRAIELGRSSTPGDFDQRHNLVLVGSTRLPHGWRLGARFRLASGYPLTPVIGADGFTSPIYGPTNSARYPVFHQLDVRVDRRWVFDRAVLSAYLDVQNVYGVMIPEVYLYSADFRDRVGFGLPIFPAFGLDVRW